MSDYERCEQAVNVLSGLSRSRNPFKNKKAKNWVIIGIELIPNENDKFKDFGVVIGSLAFIEGNSELPLAESILDKASLQDVPVRIQLASQPIHIDYM